MIERDEGRRYSAYPDPLTHAAPWTIGVGHTGPEVHQGLIWNDDQIDFALELDVDDATQACMDHFTWFSQLNDARQAVLISMMFQMGPSRVLAFKTTLSMIACGNFAAASQSMLDSVWAHQTPLRCARLAMQMKSGVWENEELQ